MQTSLCRPCRDPENLDTCSKTRENRPSHGKRDHKDIWTNRLRQQLWRLGKTPRGWSAASKDEMQGTASPLISAFMKLSAILLLLPLSGCGSPAWRNHVLREITEGWLHVIPSEVSPGGQ